MKLKYILQITIIVYLILSSVPQNLSAATRRGIRSSIQATVPGKFSVTLFGYTAPTSIVQVNGVRVFAQASSDITGYFRINKLLISDEAQEICISTIDKERRLGFPICINPEGADKLGQIGPLLLAPTLSISSRNIIQDNSVHASGITFPNSEIKISFFELQPDTLTGSLASNFLSLFKTQVYANELPIWTAKSDQNGSFSFNLPTAKSLSYRFFVKASYEDSPTPKSHTLVYQVTPFTDYFIRTILPWLIFLLIIILTLTFIIIYDRKTGKIRRLVSKFSRTKMMLFVSKKYLQLRRSLYNFRQWRMSNQIRFFPKHR